jgi:signal transduction histidine kinase
VKGQSQSPGKLVSQWQRKATLCTRLLGAVGALAAQAADVKDIIQLFLRNVCEITGWPVAHTRILRQGLFYEDRVPADIWYVGSGHRSELLRQAVELDTRRSETAWPNGIGKPILLSNLSEQAQTPGAEVVGALKSGVAVPVSVGDKLRGISEFFSYEDLELDPLWEEVMTTIAATLASAIEHRWFEESLNEMRGKLLNLQDVERRRLARELHDTTGQNISLMIINMDSLERESLGFAPAIRSKISECGELARRSLQEIRTFSYILHPPMLDELGVIAALRVFVEGFSERSGIAVDLDLPDRTVRLPRELELTIFRVVQESLSNVRKHSHSPTARVRMSIDRSKIVLTVKDKGTGFHDQQDYPAQPAKIGVGIGGMLERVQQCGGQLKISPGPDGTQVEVTLPLPPIAKAAKA